jgi:hypothetical protein
MKNDSSIDSKSYAGETPNAAYFLSKAKPLECASLLAPSNIPEISAKQAKAAASCRTPWRPSGAFFQKYAALGETPVLPVAISVYVRERLHVDIHCFGTFRDLTNALPC